MIVWTCGENEYTGRISTATRLKNLLFWLEVNKMPTAPIGLAGRFCIWAVAKLEARA